MGITGKVSRGQGIQASDATKQAVQASPSAFSNGAVRPYFFFPLAFESVLAFLLPFASFLSSACRRSEASARAIPVLRDREAPALLDSPFRSGEQAARTFRFLPSSFGACTVKKPSRRPCCLADKRILSLSAPLRTRSSLKKSGRS